MVPSSFSHLIVSTFFSALVLAAILQHCPTNGFPQPENSTGASSVPKKMCREESRVFLNETGKCYHTGVRGPCGETMGITRLVGSDIGQCASECENSKGCLPRPKVYWPQKNRCYFIFEQGPCPSSQWLVHYEQTGPKCETVPCLDEYNSLPKPFDSSPQFLFSYKGKCYISATSENSPCPAGETAYFVGLQHECRRGYRCSYNGGGLPRNGCTNGTSDGFGGCEPRAYF